MLFILYGFPFLVFWDSQDQSVAFSGNCLPYGVEAFEQLQLQQDETYLSVFGMNMTSMLAHASEWVGYLDGALQMFSRLQRT